MKANELMIGDWVIRGNITEEPTRITDICASKNNVYLDLSGIPILEKIDKINPIPLTPEILDKNGFIWTGGGDSSKMFSTPWGYDGIRYNLYVGLKKKTIEVHAAHPELRSESWPWRKVNKVSLEVCGCYVHELQHALRLCGIDKEIVL